MQRVLLAAMATALMMTLPAGATAPTTPRDPGAEGRDRIDRALTRGDRASAEAARHVKAGLTVIGPVEVPFGDQGSEGAGVEQVAAVEADDPAAPLGWAYADRAGDLDGDGRDDALTWVEDAEGVRWVALSGIDGRTLWRSGEAPVGYVIALGLDLTGDGVDDLLERAFDGDWTDGSCANCPPSTSSHYEGTVTLTLRSGADGSVVWTRTDRDHHIEVDGESEDTTTRSWTTTISTRLLGVDGGQVALAHIDHHVEEVEERQGASLGVYAVNGERTIDGTTTVEWLDGASGTTTVSGTLPRSLAGVYAEGLADLTGDGTTDLLVSGWTDVADTWTCVEVPGGSVCPEPRAVASDEQVHLVDGASANSVWSFQNDFWSPQLTVLGDVDEDGAADFALEDWSTAPPVLRVFSGRTQVELWSREDANPRSHGRAGGQALLIVEESDSEAEVFVRLDAATGEEVLRTTHQRPEEYDGVSWDWVGPGDVNGDGMPEVWLDITYSQHDGEGRRTVGGHHFVEDGVTGDRIFDLPADEEGFDVWTSAIDDLDGDGGDDVQIRDWEAGTVAFRRGADFSPLWVSDAWLIGAGDMDGLPGQEFLTTGGCSVTSLAGTSGEVRWSVELCGG